MPVTKHWHRRRAFGRPKFSRLTHSYFGVMAYLPFGKVAGPS
jgi:hypothetical protein